MTDVCDVVVLGGGHNGLVCAALIARAGLDVVVVEQNDRAGGALFASTWQGFTLEHGAVEHTAILTSGVVEELDLAHHGLMYETRAEAGAHLFADGTCITLGATVEETAESIAAVEPADAEAWVRLAQLGAPVLAALAAAGEGWSPSGARLARLARATLGRRTEAFVELATQSVLDLGAHWFASPHVRALAVSRTTFAGLPPWYPGTGAVFCLTPAGQGRRFGRPVGGSSAFVAALEAALTAAGGALHTGARVDRLTRGDSGWVIHGHDGTTRRARRAVVSTIAPPALLALLAPASARALRRVARAEVVAGNLAQLTLAAALATPAAMPAGRDPRYRRTMLHLADHPAAVLDGAASAAVGQLPTSPAVLMTQPSLMDPEAAPPGSGGATLWANVFAAHRLGGGARWDDAEADMAERIWRTIDACLPGTSASARHAVLTTPADLTRRTSAENAGNHVAPTLAQSFGGRPAVGLAGYRTPVPGLYLSGAGTNPGGGISGVPGRNAARRLLGDLSGERRAPVAATIRSSRRWSKLARSFR